VSPPADEPRWRRYLRLHGRDPDADTNVELAFHLDERARMYERAGMSPEAARRAAAEKMGDLVAIRRECAREDRVAETRRRRRERAATLGQDLRYAWRTLRKRPGFTSVAVLTLALGVGATAGMFGVVDSVLFRPLPYPTEDRIAVLSELSPEGAPWTVAPGKISDWREQMRSFSAFAVLSTGSFTLTGAGEPEQVAGALASADAARVFGVSPRLGRWFSPDEAASGVHAVVLSHRLWVERYGGGRDVFERPVILDGQPYDVIGVMPPGYAPLRPADLWLPLGPLSDAREAHYLYVAALLGHGVELDEARTEAALVADRLAAANPDTDAGYGIQAVSLRQEELGDARPAMLLWLGAVGLVLLIGAANLANLLLARVSTRLPEMALRRSLGASRLRIVRQLLTENLVLAGLAGAFAVGIAFLVERGIGAVQPGTLPRMPDSGLDARVILVALGLAAVAALCAGLLPAWRLSRRPEGELVGGVGRRAAAGIRRDRLMTGLIVGEIGIAVMLTVGAALLIRTLRELQAVDPGFETADRVVFRVSLPDTRYETEEAMRSFYADLRRAIGALPGVRAVGAANRIPLEGVPWFQTMAMADDPDGEAPTASAPFRVVTPGYLEAAGIRLLGGRPLDERDRAEAPPVVVIGRGLAEVLFPGRDAIGRRLRISYGDDEEREVVGVVEDVRQYGLGSRATPGVYVPVGQVSWSSQTFVVYTKQPLETLAPAIRQQVWHLDPDLPVYDLATVEDRLASSLDSQRFRMMLLTAFAGLALLLGIVGVYGVLSYAVSQRAREIGIRLALGAGPGRVVASIIRWGAALGAVGIGLGIAGSLGLTRLIESQLFGVEARDPAILTVVAAVIALAILAAAWIPARRAARVDPTETLRQE